MSSSHSPALVPQSALRSLIEFAESRSVAGGVENLEEFERDLRRLCADVECELVAQELQRLDVDVPAIELDGERYRRVLRCEETYFGAAGPLRVMRSLYSRYGSSERSVCLLELRAGIVEGRWTPLAAKQAMWTVAHMTPHEGEEMFQLMGGMTPSKSSLDRLPKQLGQTWEEERLHFEENLREAEAIPDEATTVAVSLDGVMLPMKDGQRARKRAQASASGKKVAGPAGYQEAGCATLSLLDAEGERLSTVRMARMPEPGKDTLKWMLRDELKAVLEERPDLRLVKIADGARDNWTYFDELPEGAELVDFYHAAEHLNAALVVAYGETNTRGRTQFTKLRHILRHERDGVDKVIRSLRYLRTKHPRRTKIEKEVKYFERNRERMRYAEAAASGLPIGSGVVEAACKTLVTQRLKRSGMRWRHKGGQAILTFRALAQSDRFERGWKLLAATYKHPVAMPENVVAFRPKPTTRTRLSV